MSNRGVTVARFRGERKTQLKGVDVTFSNRKLDGKVAFVTGGSRGIGGAIERRLAAESRAAPITYSSSSDDAEGVIRDIARLGRRGVAIRADSADTAAVKAAVGSTANRFGRLD